MFKSLIATKDRQGYSALWSVVLRSSNTCPNMTLMEDLPEKSLFLDIHNKSASDVCKLISKQVCCSLLQTSPAD